MHFLTSYRIIAPAANKPHFPIPLSLQPQLKNSQKQNTHTPNFLPMSKLLGELLQEQQEPFVLEAYLLERGYLGKFKRFDTWESFSLKKRLHVGRRILKSVVGQLVGANSRNKDNNLGNNGGGENTISKRGQVLVGKEVCAEGGVIKWGAAAAAAVSVLQEGGSPLNHRKKPNLKAPTQRVSSSSASTSQHKSKQQQVQEIASSNSEFRSEYSRNKRYVEQTKQLLIDCVREVIECHRERGKGRILGGDEEVWKLVCERAWQWSREPIDETNIIHLVHHHFLDGERSRDSDEQWRMGVSMEIGDAILGDVIAEVMTIVVS